MIFLGADPGKSGAYALVDSQGVLLETMQVRRTNIHDQLETLHRWRLPGGAPHALLERVNAKPRFAGGERKPMPATSAFSFGASWGEMRTAIIASGWSLHEMTPAQWMAKMGLRGGDKHALRDAAMTLHPGTKITLDVADAVLLAHLAWSLYQER